MAVNPLHIIFGVKLRQARLERGLSVTELAERARLSPSYVTEIEKGRKHPKADKIMRLAEALGYDFEKLVSRTLDPPLAFLEGSLTSKFWRDFPLEMFGIDPSMVVDALTRSPAEMSALLQALRDVARGYNITEQHFFLAALRSYQEYHRNYFQDLEDEGARYAARSGLAGPGLPSEGDLRAILETEFGYRLDVIPLATRPSLAAFRAIHIPGPRPSLLLNPGLLASQRKFVLAREIGYNVLAFDERALTHPPGRPDSFSQVLHDFKAAYFGGVLLMPQAKVVADLRNLFSRERWEPDGFLRILDVYDVTPETLLYRLSELVPQFFDLKVHFLRFNNVEDNYWLYKQLNMSDLSLPTGIDLHEHFCRRWLTVRLLKELVDSGGPGPIVGIQRSKFLESQKEFLCFGVARQDNLPPFRRASIILGIRYEDDLHKVVRFAEDPAIPEGWLHETCERCPLGENECEDRAAPPVRWLEFEAARERERDLRALIASGNDGGRPLAARSRDVS